MPLWLIFGFVAISLWGLSYFFGKIATNHITGSSTKLYLYIGNIFATTYAFHLSGFRIEPHYRAGMMAVVAGLLTAFANLFLYVGLNRGGRASILVPISNLYPLVTFLFAYLLLHERISTLQGCGIVCAVASIVLMG